MKKLILSQLLISLLFITTSFGQTEKGNYLLGGNASFSFQSLGSNLGSFKNINFNPNLGYFIKDNLALGVKIPISISGIDKDHYTLNYGANIFSRYYFAKTDFSSFFGSATIGMMGIDYKEYTDGKRNGFNAGLGVGCTFFLNKNIGLESELLYNYSKFKNVSDGSDIFSINFGFQIYFNKQKK